MDEIIFLSSIANDKGTPNTPNSELNKGKEVMNISEDIKDNYELYQEALL